MNGTRTEVLYGAALDTLEVLLSGLGGGGRYALPTTTTDRGLRASLAVNAPAPEVGTVVELEDPDGTPVARLTVGEVSTEPNDMSWIGGDIVQLRSFEHGPSTRRLSRSAAFGGHLVALFNGRPRAADVLASQTAAGSRPVDFVYVGPSAGSVTMNGIEELEACIAQLPHSRVWFLPEAALIGQSDAALLIVRELGATDPLDFRGHDAEPVGGAVVVFTGLSGSGKSTLARGLVERLHIDSERVPVLLDGDDVRRQLSSELGFSAEDRNLNLQRVAWVGARIAEAGGIAVCAPIAPFASSRAEMRRKVEPRSTFFLVHVSTPLAVAEARDRKGLYAKARAGLISDFTGIDSPYEIPLDSDVVVDTSNATIDECVTAVLAGLRARGVLPERASLGG